MHTASKRFWQCLDALRAEISRISRPIQVIPRCTSRPLQMVDFIAFESASTTAHLASRCQAAYIGFGSEHMASMTSSSANRLLVADTQHQNAASRSLLRAGQRPLLNSMSPCPHCMEMGVTSFAKRWSSREHPATCSHCGRLSHVIASTSSGIFVAPIFIVGIFSLIGAVNDVALLGWFGVPAALGHNLWAWKRATLWPISSDSAKSAHRSGLIVNVLALLGIFLS